MKVSVTAVPLTVATTSVCPETEEGVCDDLDPDGEDGPTDTDEPAEDGPVEEAESAGEDDWEFAEAGADRLLEGTVENGDVLIWVLLPDCNCDGNLVDN